MTSSMPIAWVVLLFLDRCYPLSARTRPVGHEKSVNRGVSPPWNVSGKPQLSCNISAVPEVRSDHTCTCKVFLSPHLSQSTWRHIRILASCLRIALRRWRHFYGMLDTGIPTSSAGVRRNAVY